VNQAALNHQLQSRYDESFFTELLSTTKLWLLATRFGCTSLSATDRLNRLQYRALLFIAACCCCLRDPFDVLKQLKRLRWPTCRRLLADSTHTAIN
jgi:hypothetical protein